MIRFTGNIRRAVLLFMIAVMCAMPTVSVAGVALDTVKGYADRVLEILRDPALKPESMKKTKKDRIRQVSEKMFDFHELSRRTLGQSWGSFSPEQQKEFVTLYRSLLEDAYADKILSYSDERIVFTKEVQLTEKTIEVQSTVFRRTAEVPIFYRVLMKDGAWRVYDVVIEGVSLISNYRTQFRDILSNKTPEALLDTLRKKVGKA